MIRHKLNLWLKADQAFGLSAEAVKVKSVAKTPTKPPAAPVAPAPAPRYAPRAPVSINSIIQEPLMPRKNPPVEVGFDIVSPYESSVLSKDQKIATLAELNESQVKPCKKCILCEKRTNTVFGEGDVMAQIMFVGEGPGADEDEQGRPFVGRAGQKLTEMIIAMGLTREQVYIGNIVKCRPPDNRVPAPDEMASCIAYLYRQIEIIRPTVLVSLGLTASRGLLKTQNTMSRMRGQWHSFKGIKTMPTFHPSYVLRNYTPETRKQVWSDLQLVMAEVGLPKK
jgi:uracil-DNA glycosylase